MADTKVASQLANMVKFIEKEANEKALEIKDKTQSEYSIEKSKIVIVQKEKITLEFNRKQQQVLIDRRIANSHEITKSRLEILQARDVGIRDVVDKTANKLEQVSQSPEYKHLLVKLILQGVAKLLDEKEILVQVREEDLRIAQEAIPLVNQELKKYGKNNNVTLDTTFHLHPAKSNGKGGETCCGGVKLSAKGGKIVCDNTLDARLRFAYDDLVPILRKVLFDEPDRVPTVVERKHDDEDD